MLVGAGGAIGATARFVQWLLANPLLTPTLVEFPWATFWVNVTGCLALGALCGYLEVRPGRPWMMPLLGTGLLGGFTTMSTVVLEGSAMIGADFPILALFYALATVIACLLAICLGLFAGERVTRRLEAADAEHHGGAA